MESIVTKTLVIKKIECFKHEKMPLHQECPYGKKKIDKLCELCIRKTETIIKINSEIIEEK